MGNKISGFSGLRDLMAQAKEKAPTNTVKKKEQFVSGEYPLVFSRIRCLFGEDHGVHHKLKRGVAVLSNDAELDQYLHSFGNMHEAKLIKAYDRLFESFSILENKEIEILDYACGQGIASITFLNYIENKFKYCLSNLSKITLIEPSKPALNRASSLLKKSARLQCVNKYFDDLIESDLKSSDSSTKIHIFSNILDMGSNFLDVGDTCFELEKLTNIILKSQRGVNYFVCVSPLKKDKLDYFMSMFKSSKGFEHISELDEKLNNTQNWEIVLNIFKVGN